MIGVEDIEGAGGLTEEEGAWGESERPESRFDGLKAPSLPKGGNRRPES